MAKLAGLPQLIEQNSITALLKSQSGRQEISEFPQKVLTNPNQVGILTLSSRGRVWDWSFPRRTAMSSKPATTGGPEAAPWLRSCVPPRDRERLARELRGDRAQRSAARRNTRGILPCLKAGQRRSRARSAVVAAGIRAAAAGPARRAPSPERRSASGTPAACATGSDRPCPAPAAHSAAARCCCRGRSVRGFRALAGYDARCPGVSAVRRRVD
jgi:hypothetical protein